MLEIMVEGNSFADKTYLYFSNYFGGDRGYINNEVATSFARHFARMWGPDELDHCGVVRPRSSSDDSDLSAFSRGLGPGTPTGGVNPRGEPAGRTSAASGEGTSVRLLGRLAAAGVTEAVPLRNRKPEWMRVRLHHGPEVMSLKHTMAELNLVTVCEEAGCPNLSECWSTGTATSWFVR